MKMFILLRKEECEQWKFFNQYWVTHNAMISIVESGLGYPTSTLERGYLHYTLGLYTCEKCECNYFLFSYG